MSPNLLYPGMFIMPVTVNNPVYAAGHLNYPVDNIKAEAFLTTVTSGY
ncbi:hypothetical protein [Citrobacter koseri]